MRKIKMLRDEIISYGPIRLLKDQEIELPEEVVSSLVGRGIAEYIDPKIAQKTSAVQLELPLEPVEPVEPVEVADLEEFSVAELREIAKEEGHTGVSKLNKSELIDLLD